MCSRGCGTYSSKGIRLDSRLLWIIERTADLVTSEEHMLALEQTRADHISQCVVLFVEGKDASGRDTWSRRQLSKNNNQDSRQKEEKGEHTGIDLDLDFLLSRSQDKGFEPSKRKQFVSHSVSSACGENTDARCKPRFIGIWRAISRHGNAAKAQKTRLQRIIAKDDKTSNCRSN